MRLRFVVGVALGFAAVGNAVPQDYPQWRGVSRDGSASAFKEPQSWPDALRRRWLVDVGEGYATPLVIGRTLYVFARREDSEMLIALDADTGVERWQSSYPAPYSPSRPAAAHGAGPKTTPVHHRGKLFTLGISGTAAAFDAQTGRIVHQQPRRHR